jgi:RHS repeat-associated protein
MERTLLSNCRSILLKHTTRGSAFWLCLLALAINIAVVSPSNAQVKPNCDSSCGGSGSTSTADIQARTAPQASRGVGTRTAFARRVGKTVLVAGSNSFTYAVPLFELPGRGINLNLALYYNSFIWTVTGNSINLNKDRDTPSYGFRLDFGWLQFCCAGDGVSSGVLTEANGAKHLIEVSASGQYVTTDSSGIQLQNTNTGLVAIYRNGTKVTYTLINPAGFELAYRPITIEDTNGNVISINYLNNNNLLLSSVIDTLGRTISFGYDPTVTRLVCVTLGNACNAPGQPTYNFNWNQNYVLNFAFNRGTGSVLHSGTTVLNVLTGVVRPDGTSVTFGYGDWAVVNNVSELSATGLARYSTSYDFPAASAGALQFNPTFTKQTVNDGVQTAVWNYQSTINSTTGLVLTMAVTDPLGTTNATTFSSNGDSRDGLPIKNVICGPGSLPSCQVGTGTTILRTTNQTWNIDATTGFNPRPATLTATFEDGQTQSEVVYNTYDANGNLTDLLEYDFGPGAHGALLRETVSSYATLANNILDRPKDIQVKDGSGKVLFHKKLNYDEWTPTTVTASLPGRDASFSAGASGNLTSAVVYANAAAGTGPVTTIFTYDSLGNLLTTQAGCCTFTQRNFSATTQYAYPDSVVIGPTGNQLSTSFTYNMATGTVATTTDPNGQQTAATYDVDNRPKTKQRPDGVVVTNLYDDSSAFPSVTTSNTANSLVTETTLDGRGRTLTQQALNGTSPVSIRSFGYDAAGRLKQASNPYSSGTPLYTNYHYDALGRVDSVTPPALVTGGAQNGYGISYSLATSTFTDPAGRQRKQYKDALGHLTRVDEPGLIGGQSSSASATMSGAEQSASVANGNGATAGTASISFGGSTDRSTVVLTHAATPATVTVRIAGTDASNSDTICTTTCRIFTKKDTGTISFTVVVGGVTVGPVSTTYGASSTPAILASGLFAHFPANSVVTMSNPNGGSSFILTTTATGNSNNTSTISTSMVTDCIESDTWACGGPGWSMNLSGPSLAETTVSPEHLSGGSDNVWTTFYDTGTANLTITANATNYSKTSLYGQNSTPASIATDLANQVNADTTLNKLIIAGASGNVLQLTTTATGTATAYPLSTSAATNSQYFTAESTSFTATPSGSAFTPGQNGTLYDSGTIKATVTGFSQAPVIETATFGQGSTSVSVATSLASAFHNDPFSPVDATVASGSSTINFTARTQGADANNYSISIVEQSSQSASFPSSSFSSVSVQLAGGVTPTASLDPGVVLTTTYSYDAMGDLLQSVQGQQTRTYQYDSLGRVTSAIIPESGYQALIASYTDFGALSQVADPRLVPGTSNHITTTYGYDELNRPKTVTYNDGTPGVTYAYNPPGSAHNTGGRLASVTNNIALESYQYDILGRPTLCSKTIAGQNYNTAYQYNTDGTVASITYPSGRIIGLSEDAIGRLTQVANNGAAILSVGSYNAAGDIVSETYGNGVAGTYSYNNQLQLASLGYTGSATILNLTYNYGGAQDNGQIQSITDALVPSRSSNYLYDELGRLNTAQTQDLTSANTWKLKYSYDRYGNRLSEIPIAGMASMPMNEVLVDSTTNRITSPGYAYDAAGNMTSDGLFNYSFNAAGEMTSVVPVGTNTATATFGYDSNGLRVIKNGTVYIYSGRKVIAEYASGAVATSPVAEHIYRGNLRLATIASGVTKYHYGDHLSVRVDTDSSGNVVRNYGSYPFGGTWYETLGTDKWKFTSYENDSESGLNYAGARYQSTRVGRFTALDPAPGHRRNPQSLNRYAYANNDPINLIDPTGMESDCNEFSNCDDSFAQLQDTGCASTFAGCDSAGDYGPPGADSNNDLPDAPTPNDGTCQWCTGADGAVNVDFVFNGNDRLIDPGTDPGSSNPSDFAGINENDGLDTLGGSQSDDFPVGSLAWNTFGPPSRRTWNGAYIVGEFAFGGTGVAIAGPAIIGELATMGTMQVAVMEGEPFHVAFGADGTMVHASGETLGNMTIEQLPGRFFTMNNIPVYNIPVLNPSVVVPAIGSAAASCVTSACMGFVRGWTSF